MPEHVVRNHPNNMHQTTFHNPALVRVGTKLAVKAAKHIFQNVKKAYRQSKIPKTVVKKEQKLNLDAGHSGVGKDTIKINENGPLKLLKSQSSGGIWRYEQTHRALITSISGNQTITDLCSVNTTNQCYLSTGNSYGFWQNAVALENLNPYLLPTGGPYLTNAYPLNDRFVVKNNEINIELTNFSSVGAIIDIYILKPKKANKDFPTSIWRNGLAMEGVGQLAATGLGPGSGGASAQVGYQREYMVGVKPNASSQFRSYFKTCAVKNITLAPASTEILNIDILVNKVVKEVDLMEENNTNIIYRPQTSYSIMLVVRGCLVIDNTTSGSPTPTYGPVKIGVITLARTQCGAVKGGNANRLAVNTIIDNIPSNATNANLTLLNEVDNVVNPTL